MWSWLPALECCASEKHPGPVQMGQTAPKCWCVCGLERQLTKTAAELDDREVLDGVRKVRRVRRVRRCNSGLICIRAGGDFAASLLVCVMEQSRIRKFALVCERLCSTAGQLVSETC